MRKSRRLIAWNVLINYQILLSSYEEVPSVSLQRGCAHTLSKLLGLYEEVPLLIALECAY